jgi:nitrogen fixation NifU-like protein
MLDAATLYQDLILDHSRRPRGCRFPEHANCEADGHNPLCGDRLTVKVREENGVVVDVGFQGSGCAISTAAASTMTQAVSGMSRSEVLALAQRFRDLVTGQIDPSDAHSLGKLAAFVGVSKFPMRVKCATLAWHTLVAALEGHTAATTEADE